MKIPFNKPFLTGRELSYIAHAHELGHLSGDGEFTKNVRHGSKPRLDVDRLY